MWKNIQHDHEDPCIHSMADSGIGPSPDCLGPIRQPSAPVLVNFLPIRATARHLRAGIYEYDGNPRLGSGAWYVGNLNGRGHLLLVYGRDNTRGGRGGMGIRMSLGGGRRLQENTKRRQYWERLTFDMENIQSYTLPKSVDLCSKETKDCSEKWLQRSNASFHPATVTSMFK